ncbi:unnamed protein product [Didymodactylos carnosus]|uniref:Uncharacterized protein n=1 Tax=Didymodactylos carnosus TaxID=1234261 RepID=A0A814LNE5_9BILA|nr:unnamed protein product [Didymodactylos carnosus]CAF1544848.1 unnamed protein product [Didymodactylos carnosus]CAF3834099.1 unnamed protein product [Didymodactylos carnosus]CAF4333713.1 unnamed protein product [Didymodactylos carnosus]
MTSNDIHPLHRSAEIEDLSHITKADEAKLQNESLKNERNNLKTTTNLHRSEEIEDLSHLSSKDMNKPLNNNSNIDDTLRIYSTATAETTYDDQHHQPLTPTFGSTTQNAQQQQFPLHRTSEMEDIHAEIKEEESSRQNSSPIKNEQRKLIKCNTIIGDSSKYN